MRGTGNTFIISSVLKASANLVHTSKILIAELTRRVASTGASCRTLVTDVKLTRPVVHALSMEYGLPLAGLLSQI